MRHVLVKLGGEVVEQRLPQICAEIIALARTGARILVTHGGGPQITALSKQLGLPTQMVAGRRVTDAATLGAVQMALVGQVNVALQNGLQAAGLRAVGLHGVVEATRRPPRVIAGAGPDPVDLGYVGDPSGFDLTLLEQLLDMGFVPVVACLGRAADGSTLNINADLVASELALKLELDALVMVTSAPGVMRDLRDPSSRIPRLTVAEGRALIESGVVQGGMIAKLDEALNAVEAGVKAIYIVEDHLVDALLDPGTVGTVLVP